MVMGLGGERDAQRPEQRERVRAAVQYQREGGGELPRREKRAAAAQAAEGGSEGGAAQTAESWEGGAKYKNVDSMVHGNSVHFAHHERW